MTSIVSKFWLVYGQHDAACRVIARLKKERDEARSLLAQADRQIPMSASMAANAPALSNGKRGSLFMCFYDVHACCDQACLTMFFAKIYFISFRVIQWLWCMQRKEMEN